MFSVPKTSEVPDTAPFLSNEAGCDFYNPVPGIPTLVVTLPLVWNVLLKPGRPVLTDIPIVPKFNFTPGIIDILFLNRSPT